MRTTTKEKIDNLPVSKLLEFREKIINLDHPQRMTEAGRFLCSQGFLHWNGTDSEYIISKSLKMQ